MKEFFLRYQRQIILDNFGMKAQEKLSNAKVLVIGAGGLGCPILQYLVAAGVGNIGIVDDDAVSLNNLQRQILFGQEDIGKNKSVTAVEKLKQLNDLVTVIAYPEYCNQVFALEKFSNYDIIVDATDNFASRYLINDACVLLQKPLVFGAVSKYEGQVAVFNAPGEGPKLSYRDLFPEPPKGDEVMSCAIAGVLGVIPGIIGTLQATEVIKLITGIGEVLANQLLTYHALYQRFYTIALTPHPQASLFSPGSVEEFIALNYQEICS
ncbi:MAG: HesA/MoeB/ThiF family protein [Chitinophagia bacterium]